MFAIHYCVLFFTLSQSMKVIPERIEIHTMNEDYIEGIKANVRRYGRKSAYYLNLEGNLKHSWGNNISFDVILFELLHNEYKQTFVEFHFERGCDLVYKDPYIGKALSSSLERRGITCPVASGHVVLANLSLPMDAFPYVWPFERAKAVGVITTDHKRTFIANGSLYLRFDQTKHRA